MKKAILIDYTGTITQEKGKDIEEVVVRIWKNSNLDTPEDALKFEM